MDKLKKLRVKNKLTYQTMADTLNISKSYYWQIENGRRRLTYDMAIKISKIFKTTPDYIFYNDYKKRDQWSRFYEPALVYLFVPL